MAKNNKDEIKKHEILKQCAIYAYGKTKELPSGCEFVKNVSNWQTGFSASVLKNNDEIIIAFRGTELPSMDAISDIQMWQSKIPFQAKDAVKLFWEIKSEYPNAKINLTGHSLGGSLAQIVAAVFDAPAVTFNAYGTKNVIKTDIPIYPDKIVNYVNLSDFKIITNNTRNQIGKCYSVFTRGFSKNEHEAEAIEPLDTREEFDQRTFGIPFRNPGKQHKEIHTGDTECKGSYHVDGYTRADGTEVKSYTRNCYIHGSGVTRSYFGKKLDILNNSELQELYDDYI